MSSTNDETDSRALDSSAACGANIQRGERSLLPVVGQLR